MLAHQCNIKLSKLCLLPAKPKKKLAPPRPHLRLYSSHVRRNGLDDLFAAGVTEGSVTLSNLLGTAEKTSISAEIGSRHSRCSAMLPLQPWSSTCWHCPAAQSQQPSCCLLGDHHIQASCVSCDCMTLACQHEHTSATRRSRQPQCPTPSYAWLFLHKTSTSMQAACNRRHVGNACPARVHADEQHSCASLRCVMTGPVLVQRVRGVDRTAAGVGSAPGSFPGRAPADQLLPVDLLLHRAPAWHDVLGVWVRPGPQYRSPHAHISFERNVLTMTKP